MSILDELRNDALGRPVALPNPEADRLPASFRGVEFWVPSTEDEIGRQQVVHEFPTGAGEDEREPFAEDVGAVTGRFVVEAFLIGPQINADRVFLESALNTRGPGKLIHPKRGELTVSVDGRVRVRWQTSERNMLRFSIPFVATGEQPQPVAEFGLGADVDVRAGVVNALVEGGADSLLDTSGPAFLGQDVVDSMTSAAASLQSASATVSGQIGVVNTAARAITDFSTSVATLITAPATMAAAFQGLVNSVMAGITSISNAVEQYDRGDTTTNRTRAAATLAQVTALGTFGDSLSIIPQTTATQRQQAQNQAFTKDLVEASSLAEGARALAQLPFESADQARQAFDEIDTVFERVLLRGTVTDDVDGALRDLRVSLARFIEHRSTRLSVVSYYTPATSTPLLLVAQHVHGDATRDGEIALRNDVEWPGFAPALRPLEILVS